MSISRRNFVAGAAAMSLTKTRPVTARTQRNQITDRFDPWIEVDEAALRHNVGEVARLAGGRPILAVVKNNAYGLGLTIVGPMLAAMPQIAGLAVVKASAAIALRDAGVDKPILLMGMSAESDARELVSRGIAISLYTDDAVNRVERLANRVGRPVDAHLYLDTGMGRMGMPYTRALTWMRDLAPRAELRIGGTFMAFVEETDFDREQLRRFTELTDQAKRDGLHLGRLHAASSNGVFHLPQARLDMVRPGIALYGGYPSHPEIERAMSTLRPAFRLKARVVRVVRLRPGDSVSYGRNYVAERDTWIATLPVGHADGYPRQAVNGARVLIGENLYPVIGAVSASHAIVEIGTDKRVEVGDTVTLVGPDRPEIMPNALAAATGVSVYDILMHLNPELPRVVVG